METYNFTIPNGIYKNDDGHEHYTQFYSQNTDFICRGDDAVLVMALREAGSPRVHLKFYDSNLNNTYTHIFDDAQMNQYAKLGLSVSENGQRNYIALEIMETNRQHLFMNLIYQLLIPHFLITI